MSTHKIPIGQAVRMVETMRTRGHVEVSIVCGTTFFGQVAPNGLVVVRIVHPHHSASVQVTLWDAP